MRLPAASLAPRLPPSLCHRALDFVRPQELTGAASRWSAGACFCFVVSAG